MNNSYSYQKIKFHTFTKQTLKGLKKEGFQFPSLTLKNIFFDQKGLQAHSYTIKRARGGAQSFKNLFQRKEVVLKRQIQLNVSLIKKGFKDTFIFNEQKEVISSLILDRSKISMKGT